MVGDWLISDWVAAHAEFLAPTVLAGKRLSLTGATLGTCVFCYQLGPGRRVPRALRLQKARCLIGLSPRSTQFVAAKFQRSQWPFTSRDCAGEFPNIAAKIFRGLAIAAADCSVCLYTDPGLSHGTNPAAKTVHIILVALRGGVATEQVKSHDSHGTYTQPD